MADARPFIRPDAPHGVHDLLLIAAYAGGDVTDTEREQAVALVAGCADCATLAADLGTVRASLAVLPSPARPRDFRLTPADAARLRPHGRGRPAGGWRRPDLRLAQPFAAGLTMLGLAGLLVTAVPLGAGGAASTATGGSDSSELRLEEAAPAATPGDIGITSASEPPGVTQPPVGQVDPPRDGTGVELGSTAAGGDVLRPLVGIGSVVLIILGVVLWLVAHRRRRAAA